MNKETVQEIKEFCEAILEAIERKDYRQVKALMLGLEGCKKVVQRYPLKEKK